MASWLKQTIRPGRSARRGRRPSRPAVFEILEDRLVLSFAAPVIYRVGFQTTLGENGFAPQVITAAFGGDGKSDLAVSNTLDGTVSILMGNGDGTFQPAVTDNTGLGAGNSIWLAAADFNGDGKLDLAVEGGNDVAILMGNGNGTFQPAQVYASQEIRGRMAVGDFFGKGRQDIAVAAFTSNDVEILPNNGNGTFGSPVILPMPSTFSAIRSITTANFFGNGHADLAVAGGLGSNNVDSTTNPAGVALFKNDGAGHFTFAGQDNAVTTPDPGGGDGTGDTVNPEHVNVADLNGDGKPDLVLSLYDHNIDVFLNNGNGTFRAGAGYTTETPGSVGGYPRGVAFADINHDGKVDIVSDNIGEPTPIDQAVTEPGSVSVLYGNGDGTFQAPVQYTPYSFLGGIAVGDFNGDGWTDLAVAQNYTGHSVAVMLNQPTTDEQAPTVTSINPATGPAAGGTVVQISGTNFIGTTQVDFGGVAAKSFTVNSSTSITATEPAEPVGGPSVVDVSVYNAGASATTSADKFTYLPSGQAPSVTGVSPNVGPTYGGTYVTITGTYFTGATVVDFGGVAAAGFSVTSSTTIVAKSPAESAGAVDITVTTPYGTSAKTGADHFTYQAPALASIAISPSSSTLLDGATQLFAATGLDQFGNALASQPKFSWGVSGLGTITTAGLYTAPPSGTGYSYVQAVSGGITGSARVSYSPLTSDTWTGLGSNGYWSNPANWSANAVPTSSTAVVFTSTSSKPSIVDPAFSGSISSLLLTSIFTGSVTLDRSLAISGSYTQGGGVYNANGSSTTIGGATSLYIGTFEASTATQTFNGGLSVLGGTFIGSTGLVATASVTLSSGTLDAPSTTMYVNGGNFTDTGGTFNADMGTVAYTGINVSPTVSVGTGLVKFYNFTDALADSFPTGFTITGTLTTTGTFSWLVSGSAIYGNIEAQGNFNDQNHGGIGNPYLTLDGTANQAIEDLSGVGGGQFRTITINKTGGTVSLACNPIVFSGLTLYAGTVSTGSYSWNIAGPVAASAGLNLGSITIIGTGATVTSPSLQVANVTFASSSTKLTAPTGSLYVSGNWNDSAKGVFASNGGTVVFDGTSGTQQLNSGGYYFSSLTIVAGSSVILEADLTVLGTLTTTGTLNLNGHKLIR